MDLDAEIARWRDALCDRVRRVRSQLGLAQEEFAGKAGLSNHAIGKIERKLVFPSLETLVRLSLAHGIPLARFLGEAAEPPPKSRILREIVGLLEGQDERTQALAADLVRTVVRRR